MSCCRKEETRTPGATCAHVYDIIIVGFLSPHGAYVVLGLSDHVFLPYFSYLELHYYITRLVVTSGPGFCAAHLGAPVHGTQEITIFGLELRENYLFTNEFIRSIISIVNVNEHIPNKSNLVTTQASSCRK